MSDTATSTPTGQDVKPAEGAAPTSQDPKPAEGDKKETILGNVGEPEGGDKSKEGGSKDGKPADDFRITLPEGVTVDDKALEGFTAWAKEGGLSSEAASKGAAWMLEQQQKIADSQAEAWDKQGDAWADELKADPDFGGDKLEETVTDAKRALREFGGQKAADAIAELGLGNHPTLVRMFARMGRAMRNDSSDTKRSEGGVELTDKEALREKYPTMFNEDGTQKA